MATWWPCLVLLMLGAIHSAQIASSNQQIEAAREPPVFVRFDDIVSRHVLKETAKKVYKREIIEDYADSDDSNYENASSDISSTADSGPELSNDPETTTENDKGIPIGNELDGTENTEAENTNTNSKEVSVAIEATVKSTTPTDEDAIDTEIISDGNMATGQNLEVLGKLTAEGEGSGEMDPEEVDHGNNQSGTDLSDPSGLSTVSDKNEGGKAMSSDDSNFAENDGQSGHIPIDPTNVDVVDLPDEPPISDPEGKIVDSATKDFQVDELIRVSTELPVAPKESVSQESPIGAVEGSGDEDSQETEAPVDTTPSGRIFNPVRLGPATEQPSQKDVVPQEAGGSEDPDIKKAILANQGNMGGNDGINEPGIGEGESTKETENKSSTGSYIVLGAIMMTIVVLVAYTVVKSRRQKKSRRSGNITTVEDPGREMKEVDKLLAPRTNGFSAPNGGPRDDERAPLKSFKADLNEVNPLKDGYVSGNVGGGLTDVIVENVPRLTPSPKTNGKAPNDSQSDDDQDSWVQGEEKALESTKIKMYIDEDSIPKTPIMIVNRGSDEAPDEV